MTEDITALEKEIVRLRCDKAEQADEIERLRADLLTGNSELLDQAEQEIERLRGENAVLMDNQLCAANVALRAENAKLKGKLGGSEAMRDVAATFADELDKRLGQAGKDEAALREHLDALGNLVADKDKTIAALEAENAKLREAIDSQMGDRCRLNVENTRLREALVFAYLHVADPSMMMQIEAKCRAALQEERSPALTGMPLNVANSTIDAARAMLQEDEGE